MKVLTFAILLPVCFAAVGLFGDFGQGAEKWVRLCLMAAAGAVIGLAIDFVRMFGTYLKTLIRGFAFTLAVPLLYAIGELVFRRQWPHGPGRSLLLAVLVGGVVGVVVDVIRYFSPARRNARLVARRLEELTPSHGKSSFFHS